MNTMLRWIVPLFLIAGCAMPARESLDKINPTRDYRTDLATVMQAARSFSLKEGFKIERFEQDYGRVMGSKRTIGRGLDNTSMNPDSRMIVMDLKLKRTSEKETHLTASFTFGDGQSVATRDEERLLIECYHSLFELLDQTLPQ